MELLLIYQQDKVFLPLSRINYTWEVPDIVHLQIFKKTLSLCKSLQQWNSYFAAEKTIHLF